ncbi:leukemia inhibitory factor receptor-like [Halichoeres trimaculatus]|uniref:leukemia inhibitory factor receptor-like n=1 Tax=Halichoeres trimaculatus TaxID=147232 RepID=UPI003D9E61D0
MITWLLLVLLFCESIQDKNGKESGVSQCGPQNLKLTGSDQTILATWEDNPSCSTVRDELIYEVVLTEQEVHYDEVVVMLEQIGLTHSWNRTSSLPLECVSHTVKIRSRYNNYTSPWVQENLPGRGASSQPEVYPKNKLYAVNSKVTFCCILPAGEELEKIYLSAYNSPDSKTRNISNQIHTLTVLLHERSNTTCTNVMCKSSSSKTNGACAWISSPPTDRDLKCETQNMESVDCYWTDVVGRKTYLPENVISTKYQLNGRSCPNSSELKCTLEVEGEAGERNWTLTAQNKLGKVELTDRADLMKRVRMFAPERVSAAAVNASNVTLKWEWKVQRYHDLDITCQINISHGETSVMSEASGVGLRSAVVKDLTPNWKYIVKVRCGTTQHLWKWGDWSKIVMFHTRGDVPDAVDVWMQMKNKQTFIVWKELQADQSHGDILEYEVRRAKTTERQLVVTIPTEPNSHSVPLGVEPTEEYIVTVTARNKNGSSSPSSIIIPRLKTDITTVTTSRISGSNGGFNLSWSASPAAACGYIVDWCPTSGSCKVDWLKVSPDQTNARIVSNFEDGQRYTLSVYACTHTAPVLLERREGYIKEKRMGNNIFKSLKWKKQDSDVEVSWESVPLNPSAFILGYVLYCEDNNNSKIVFNVSTNDPEATSLTATNLKSGTYTFTVKAKTAVGECGASSVTATINTQAGNLIEVVCVSLVSILALLSLVTILCFRSWPGIKHKVYPPIPKPVLTDKWLTMGDNSHHLHAIQYLYSEADIMDVPELHCKPGALVNDYMMQENLPHVSAQPLKSHDNQSEKNFSPEPFSSPTTAVSPPFNSLIINPCYSLTMEMEYQPCSSSPEPEEGMRSVVLCDEYQPQNQTANLSLNPEKTVECTDRPMPCVFTYVLLPQPTTA